MKYLLAYLEGIPDAPNLTDPDFQQLLLDVQAGKSQVKSSEAFFESLEKIVNELKSSPESSAFHKPVSKREAPNYYDIITKPMDLSTVLRLVKSHKYKSKADFANDLDLIWGNCLSYNTQENHPLRANARFMKQKADHHLEFLADKNERPENPILPLLPQAQASGVQPSSMNMHSATARQKAAAVAAAAAGQGSGAGTAGGGEEDAAGESDDAAGEVEAGQDFRNGAEGSSTKIGINGQAASRTGDRSVSRGRGASATRSPPPFRPQLQANLDTTPALVRTAHSMAHFRPLSLDQPGPSYSDKGKAKELVQSSSAPSWFATSSSDQDLNSDLEGRWWGTLNRDEVYASGLPAAPMMVQETGSSRRVLRRRKASKQVQTTPNGNGVGNGHPSPTSRDLDSGSSKLQGSDPSETLHSSPHPSLVKHTRSKRAARSQVVNLESVVHRSVDNLFEIRKAVAQIHDFQKAELDGGAIPRHHLEEDKLQREAKREEAKQLKRQRREEMANSRRRRKFGGDVGEEEAVLSVRKATAGMLAHAGFEGANEMALNLFTRVAVDQFRNLGRTMRLLMDGFSHKMTSEEMVLHTMFENGNLVPADLEAHVKDELQREEGKIKEMSRKMRQVYKEVTTAPVIEADMMFADNGEMLLDGNFADELGEDFLGLRDLGIAKEYDLSSLTVPSAIFYGRRKRLNDAGGAGAKADRPDYPPPPPFIPLSAPAIPTQLPALFHAFFASRLESGEALTDDTFDSLHSQIGSLGQIIVKNPPGANKKRGGVNKEDAADKKKQKVIKVVQPGVGKGNWIRPSKEERDRRALEKKKNVLMSITNGNGHGTGAAKVNGHGDAGGTWADQDAEGEEE